jgi:hypothetical protein
MAGWRGRRTAFRGAHDARLLPGLPRASGYPQHGVAEGRAHACASAGTGAGAPPTLYAVDTGQLRAAPYGGTPALGGSRSYGHARELLYQGSSALAEACLLLSRGWNGRCPVCAWSGFRAHGAGTAHM